MTSDPDFKVTTFLMSNIEYPFLRYLASKKPWPWNPVRGHSRSSKLVRFNRLIMVSY